MLTYWVSAFCQHHLIAHCADAMPHTLPAAPPCVCPARCGPCQMMGQILDEVAPELRGQVKIVKVDSDKFGEVSSRYNVGGE